MSEPSPSDPSPNPLREAIASAQRFADEVIQAAAEADVSQATQAFLEEATQTLGEGVEPIANHHLFELAARIPGFNWILAAVGRVDVTKIQGEVARLRLAHPEESVDELCDRIISSAAIAAGGIGLVTNIVPPLALMLMAVDIVGVTRLQAEMVFRVAALYGFDLADPARKGEVLSIFGVSLAATGAIKAGLSLAEVVPVVGTAIGVTSNAGLIYTLGNGARQFYASKQGKDGY